MKAAVFPLHGWLPDAYTYAPGAVIGFIAAVMSKVSAYALFRMLYFVLHTAGAAGHMLAFLGWTALVAMIAGNLLAIAQHDIRRMLAYSSVGQMGYIILGLALGTPAALIGTVLHIIHHAVMKGCLFLAVSGIYWRTGHCHIDDLVGISRRMPLTMAAFTVAALSLLGLPPTAGFVSKWYLLSGALEAQHKVAVTGLVVSSLLSAVYVFRIFEAAYLRQEVPDKSTGHSVQELPMTMLVPVVILAAAVVGLGLGNQTLVQHIIRFILPPPA
jgi:multicomponent Na+:H+ antiporter subunit D